MAPAATGAGRYGTDDYPDARAVCTATGQVSGTCPRYNWSGTSDRLFAKRNCTDFVAWRVGITWGSLSFPKSAAAPNGDGNARGWRQGAINSGYQTSTIPIVGSVAWWGASAANEWGHVAVVTSVNADGSAVVEEYNQAGTGAYANWRSIRADAYLYIKVSPAPEPSRSLPDSTGGALLNGATDLLSVLAKGPTNTLRTYWVSPGQPWSGPATIGGAGSTYSAPAAVVNQSTGLISAFAQGPNNTLQTYWVSPGQPWSGPATIGGAGSTYSAPAAVVNQSTGLISAFAQGPNNTLQTYWVSPGQPWSGPATIGGAGSTYSPAAAAVNPGSGLISAFTQGANNTLNRYWVTHGRPWSGPVMIGGFGSTF